MSNLVIIPSKKTEFDFTIGADPEFCCVNGRTIIESDEYVAGDDPFGSDGNGITFEVRPECSVDPVKVIGNIHDIFVRKIRNDTRFLKFNWKAGSYYAGYPLGGHIHFGIMDDKIPYETAAHILDNYVGVVSLLIENREQGLRRRGRNYGRMGDHRDQPFGFEYRTCSSWLTSPYVATAMLCLAKTVMYEVLNNQAFTPKDQVVQEDFHTMNVTKLRNLFNGIWEDVVRMKLYPTFKSYLDMLHFLVTKNLSWFPSVSMKESWGITSTEIVVTPKMKMGSIWDRYNQTIDLNREPAVAREGIIDIEAEPAVYFH